MSIFYLPDLGEGLPEAEIREWYVKEGEIVKVDQPLVAVETAKAVVDVPAPQAGKIKTLHGKPGEILKTGSALVEFEESGNANENSTKRVDDGTVVGKIETSGKTLEESSAIHGNVSTKSGHTVKTTPQVRALAKQLGVDLSLVIPSRSDNVVTSEDVKQFQHLQTEAGELEILRGPRRAMAHNMAKSHAEVVSVTLSDDADIHAWPENTDITVGVIRALIAACQAEPALNAWYDATAIGIRLLKEIHVGIAIDTSKALYVPVIKNAAKLSNDELRQKINDFKKRATDHALTPEEQRGASITISNFGIFAGRYANPIVLPPMVAIIATGKIREEVVIKEGKIAAHKIMPISLTFDHRAVTGGEASRFLGEFLTHLAQVE